MHVLGKINQGSDMHLHVLLVRKAVPVACMAKEKVITVPKPNYHVSFAAYLDFSFLSLACLIP